jgi:hypothetical protein
MSKFALRGRPNNAATTSADHVVDHGLSRRFSAFVLNIATSRQDFQTFSSYLLTLALMKISIRCFLLSTLLSRSVLTQFCYYPGENAQAPDHRPCDQYAQTSLCCPIGWTCFSNKICVVTDASAINNTEPVGRTIRGTCTDPTWNETVCGDFCLSGFQMIS